MQNDYLSHMQSTTKIHAFKDARSTSWSGGKTTEMFILPAEAIYANRDFDFRISTATIEVETSDFTALPAYNRLLAVLEGKLELIHEGKYEKQLSPLESDSFQGSWKTSSRGKARDFNVIYSDKYDLSFDFVESNENATQNKTSDFLFIFALNDSTYWKKYDLIEVADAIDLEKGFAFFRIELNLKN